MRVEFRDTDDKWQGVEEMHPALRLSGTTYGSRQTARYSAHAFLTLNG
jgi:hypothetical protein